MPRINVLDKKTAELIAAGEVVDRPASIVKELLENSIDSGADSITIEIQNGGKTYIRVSDNGCGIEKEDLPKAILRHATSKISSEEDLNNISTLGFRGEALASIAAVSRLQILSCTETSLVGSRIELCGNEIIYCGEAGSPKGTTVVVKDLFFNTPARMKFLKKDSTEGSYIQNICEKVFISNPEISFKFIKDGVTVISTPGDGKLLSAVYAVYGEDFTSSLTEVSYVFGDYSVYGFVSKPTESRSNRNMQIFYVNDRIVKSKTLYAALEEAYKGSIMTGKFPACVLFINLPYGLVDVNVHPAKTEIRFADEKSVFHTVYHAAHSGITASHEIPVKKEELKTEKIYFEPTEAVSQTVIVKSPNVFEGIERQETVIENFSNMFGGLKTPEKMYISENKPVKANSFTDAEPMIHQLNPIIAEDSAPTFKYIGQAFETYIIGQYGEDIVFIDKHAAHERLIYNQLKNNFGEENSQLLLSPIKVTLNASELSAALSFADEFSRLGFIYEEFGTSAVVIREAPVNIPTSEAKDAFLELLDLRMKNAKKSDSEIFDELLHSIACRAAVKAHDRSSDEELSAFAVKVLESDARYCPHGRPVIVKFTKRDIEKKFFRMTLV